MLVLLVEDNPDDVAAVEQVARRSAPDVCIVAVRDGQEAAEYLFQHGRYARRPAPTPQLVLLDIGLPGLRGLDLLRLLKADARLQEIPVVVLSGSDRDEDVREAETLGAHSHLVKPLKPQDFVWMARAVAAYQARVLKIAAGPRAGRSPSNAIGTQSEG